MANFFFCRAQKSGGRCMQVGENIYKYRIERGLSQGALAEALEVSRQSVSKWENNSAVPELDKLIRMSKLFQISLDQLVFGEEVSCEPAESEEKTASDVAFPRIPGHILVGCFALMFGMVFFLLSVFWGDQFRFGEEIGELISLSIVVLSVALIATYNQWVLASCAMIYFLYSILCVRFLHLTSLPHYIFMILMSFVILIWFIVWGTHATRGVKRKEPPEEL